MTRSIGSFRILVTIVALAVLVGVIALPVLAADPSGSPSPAASEPTAAPDATPTAEPTSTPAPTASPAPTAAPAATLAPAATAEPAATDDDGDGDGTQKPEKPPKADKPDKADEVPVSLSGTVGTRTDDDGDVEYTLTDGTTVLVLDAGPSWFYGDDHPLKAHVGKNVTVVGEQEAGSDEIDVHTVDGVAVREPGKPPWAGGWKVVGEKHPGWSAEKAAKWEAKRAEKAKQHGTTCWPPGHCKYEPGADSPSAENPPGD